MERSSYHGYEEVVTCNNIYRVKKGDRPNTDLFYGWQRTAFKVIVGFDLNSLEFGFHSLYTTGVIPQRPLVHSRSRGR